MQPVVHATMRTPGPSTVDPVVKECRNPMSPLASASRTLCSGTASPRWTRSSNGLRASSATAGASDTSLSVEGAVDDVHLLLARQPHEVDRVARYPNRQARVLLGVVHRIDERVAVEDVDIHVVPGGAEEGVEHRREVGDPILGHTAETGRYEGRR